jgi:2-isopropylmalate synthase
LFGNGERTGNADIVTVAMNMFSQGVDPELDFSDLPRICDFYESVTGLPIPARQPYCGSLVFAAFSGSHQDAIAKGITYRTAHPDAKWTVPYLPIDPKDVGREYDGDVIRINSQSGKGGVSYILSANYGIDVPPAMRALVGYAVKDVSDKRHHELKPDEVLDIFKENFVNVTRAGYKLKEAHYVQKSGTIEATVTYTYKGVEHTCVGTGNGRLDAVSSAFRSSVSDPRLKKFNISYFGENSLDKGSTSRAIAYVCITDSNGASSWGAGIDTDIITAGNYALFSAVNRIDDL